jgi:signal transduction histidine kinase
VAERLPLDVHLSVPNERWHHDVESAAYLVVCEALTNAVRHAGDCAVHVDLRQRADGLHVVVRDDGAGSENLRGPTALRSLRDRVAALGGDVRVDSVVGVGTTVEAVIPCV